MFVNKTDRAVRRVDAAEKNNSTKYDNDVPERRPLITWLFDEWFGLKLLIDEIQSDRRLARYHKMCKTG